MTAVSPMSESAVALETVGCLEGFESNSEFSQAPDEAEAGQPRAANGRTVPVLRKTGSFDLAIPMAADVDEDGIIQFGVSVFLKELFYNCFGFLATPFVLIIEGYEGARNRGFIGLTGGHLVQFLVQAGFMAVLILYGCYTPPDISPLEIAVLIAGWIVRQLVVATKHAYTNPTAYANLNSRKMREENGKANSERQLITGWLVPTVSTVYKEFDKATVAKDVDLDHGVFIFENEETEKIMRDLKWHEHQKANGRLGDAVCRLAHVNRAVPVKAIAVEFFMRSVRKALPRVLVVSIALLRGAVPSLMRANKGRLMFGATWPAITITALSWGLEFFIFFSNFLFMFIAYRDYARRHDVLRLMGELLSSGVPLGGRNVVLEAKHPVNVANWLLLRQAMLEFGSTYYRRIKLFSFYFAVFVLGMVAYLVVIMFGGGRWDIPGTVIMLVEMLAFTILTTMVIEVGARTNRLNEVHCLFLLRQQLRLRGSLYTEDLSRLQYCEMLLTNAIETLKVEHTLKPVTFLGITADGNFARSVVGVGLTGLASGIRVLAV